MNQSTNQSTNHSILFPLQVPSYVGTLRLSKTADGQLNLTWAREKVKVLKTNNMIMKIPANGLVKIELELPKEAHSISFSVQSRFSA